MDEYLVHHLELLEFLLGAIHVSRYVLILSSLILSGLIKKQPLLPFKLLTLPRLLLKLSPGVLHPLLVLALPAAILGLSRLHADLPGVALGASKDELHSPWPLDHKIESSTELVHCPRYGLMNLVAVGAELTVQPHGPGPEATLTVDAVAHVEI